MTRQPKPPGSPDDDALEALLADGFASRGELPPITEGEVERAELAGGEFEGELPEGLREYRPPEERPAREPGPPSSRSAPIASVRRIGPVRKGLVSHALAAALGAAAAAALFMARGHREGPTGGLPSSEPPPPRVDAAPEAKLAIGPVRRCAPCCAGTECKGAAVDLKQCSSGRSCIACSNEELLDSRYRVRVGALAPTANAKALVDAAGKGFEICVRVGSSAFACGPAHADGDGERQWTVLPLAPSAQDALAGFELELRHRGAARALGRWQSPVPINATVLCKGLFIKPKTDTGETLGVVSAFLDDAHFVELMRSTRVDALVQHRQRFEFSDVRPSIFQTKDERFALVLGPVDKPSAERLRWAILEKGQSARVVEGFDHIGDPRPLD
jgi:hypothetical protein